MARHQTVLITGATDGIGLALARLYQQRGARLVLVGKRSAKDLRDPLFRPDTYCQVDLSLADCAAQISRWLDLHTVYELDLVIHCAGTAYIGETEQQSTEHIETLLAVNLYAPIAMTHAFMPRLLSTRGKIVYIGSARATLPSPRYATYAASKMALAGFVRNLQIELAAANVGITAQILHPGATKTGLHAKAGMPDSATSKYAAAETIAKQIARTIESGVRTASIQGNNSIVDATNRHFPAMVESLMRKGRAKKNSSDPKHVVITGAANGIGKAMAAEFAEAGYIITGLDIDSKTAMYTQAELINDHGAQVRFALGDLANAHDVQRMIESVVSRPPIDVLIHNAGINAVGPFIMSNLRQQMSVLDVNLKAPLVLTAELLRQGRFAQGATVAFMSSLSHFVSYPGAAVYAASKDGLSAYASALSVGLAAKGMNVLTIYPGPTRTEHARRYSPDNSKEEQRMEPEELAELVYKAVKRGKRFLIPGGRNRSMAIGAQWFPKRAETVMQREVYNKLATTRR